MFPYLKAHALDFGLAAGIAVVSALLSLGLVTLVLIRLPPAYFQGEGSPSVFFEGRPAWQRTAAFVGKNILGMLLILVGILLSLPGVPGQGILTILVGILLVDFRGKRRIEQRIMKIPAVLRGANKIRARFGKEPLVIDELPA